MQITRFTIDDRNNFFERMRETVGATKKIYPQWISIHNTKRNENIKK